MPLTDTPSKLEAVFIQRDDGNQYYEQINISASNAIVYLDETGKINADKIDDFISKYNDLISPVTYYPYQTLTGITGTLDISFLYKAHLINVSSGVSINFISSNLPPTNKSIETTIYINNTSAAPVNFTYPISWKNIGIGWFSSLPANKSAIIKLMVFGTSIIGTYTIEP